MTSPNQKEAEDAKKAAYKVCWHCGKRFHGSSKYPVTVLAYKAVVYVHKACISDLIEDGVIDEP